MQCNFAIFRANGTLNARLLPSEIKVYCEANEHAVEVFLNFSFIFFLHS